MHFNTIYLKLKTHRIYNSVFEYTAHDNIIIVFQILVFSGI